MEVILTEEKGGILAVSFVRRFRPCTQGAKGGSNTVHHRLPRTSVATRPASVRDAETIHAIYQQAPQYFDIISIPIPTLSEVKLELSVAAQDPKRNVELVLVADGSAPWGVLEPEGDMRAVGYLDYKLDYPEGGDATINLLLIAGPCQGRGYGRQCVMDLERRLAGRARRVLASIYGQNPAATRFWRSLGYAFAIDAKPILEWYAKPLEAAQLDVSA
jgi:ribosomal protein S18 acetylase RimI-like enzyme